MTVLDIVRDMATMGVDRTFKVVPAIAPAVLIVVPAMAFAVLIVVPAMALAVLPAIAPAVWIVFSASTPACAIVFPANAPAAKAVAVRDISGFAILPSSRVTAPPLDGEEKGRLCRIEVDNRFKDCDIFALLLFVSARFSLRSTDCLSNFTLLYGRDLLDLCKCQGFFFEHLCLIERRFNIISSFLGFFEK